MGNLSFQIGSSLVRLLWAVGSGEPVRLESRAVARSELGSWNKKLARHVRRRDWWLGTWRTEIIQAREPRARLGVGNSDHLMEKMIKLGD